MEMTSTGEIVPASNDPLSVESAQQRFIKGMLKKEEVAKARSAYMEFEVHALDLADSKDAAKYVEILNRFGAVGSQWQLEESPPCIVLDSLSDRKFRCITVVKTYKMQKMMPEPPVG